MSQLCLHAQEQLKSLFFFLQNPQSLFIFMCSLFIYFIKSVKLRESSKAQRFQIIGAQTVFSFIKEVYNLLCFVFLCEEIKDTFLRASGACASQIGRRHVQLRLEQSLVNACSPPIVVKEPLLILKVSQFGRQIMWSLYSQAILKLKELFLVCIR